MTRTPDGSPSQHGGHPGVLEPGAVFHDDVGERDTLQVTGTELEIRRVDVRGEDRVDVRQHPADVAREIGELCRRRDNAQHRLAVRVAQVGADQRLAGPRRPGVATEHRAEQDSDHRAGHTAPPRVPTPSVHADNTPRDGTTGPILVMPRDGGD